MLSTAFIICSIWKLVTATERISSFLRCLARNLDFLDNNLKFSLNLAKTVFVFVFIFNNGTGRATGRHFHAAMRTTPSTEHSNWLSPEKKEVHN